MLRRLAAASVAAAPFLLLLPGCGFSSPAGSGSPQPDPGAFDPGPQPHTGVIFCNIETSRLCPSPEQIAMGVDITKQYEQGFWTMSKGNAVYGLDYSNTSCGASTPQAIKYAGTFPAGSQVCVNPQLLDAGGRYADATAACRAYCESLGDANCETAAQASTGALNVTPRGCPDGSFDARLVDLRTLKPRPVAWRDALLVNVMGNGLTRLNAPAGWTAGAASTATLGGGNGYVDFTAVETNRDRMCGLAVGAPPDNDPSFGDISFAVNLKSDGTLTVFESGLDRGVSGTYAPNDVFRVAVINGVVQYFQNGKVFYTSTATAAYPLRVDASLFTTGATLANVNTSF